MTTLSTIVRPGKPAPQVELQKARAAKVAATQQLASSRSLLGEAQALQARLDKLATVSICLDARCVETSDKLQRLSAGAEGLVQRKQELEQEKQGCDGKLAALRQCLNAPPELPCTGIEAELEAAEAQLEDVLSRLGIDSLQAGMPSVALTAQLAAAMDAAAALQTELQGAGSARGMDGPMCEAICQKESY